MKTWYQIQAKSNGDKKTAQISIHEEIGMWGISASRFMADLGALGDVSEIHLSIDSPGGSVFDAYAIANSIQRNSATVTVEVAGMAASAAAYIACSADKLIMPENSWLMLHKPWSVTIGDSDEMREAADFLDRQNEKLMKLCAAKAKMSVEQLETLITNAPGKELWLDGEQAMEMGFADEVVNRIEAYACKFDTKQFVMTPQSLTHNSDSTPISAIIEGTPSDAPVEPTAPVEAQAETPTVDETPVVTESEPAPQASLIQRAIAALTGRPDTSAIQAQLTEAQNLNATLQATNASLTARIAELEPLAREREELLAAIQTAEQLAAAQIAQAGFTPESELELPQATNVQAKSKLEQFNELTGDERTAFYNAHREELTKFIQTPSK